MEDVDAVVGFLKTRVSGASVSEAKAVIDPKYLDGRKISGYESWGFVQRDGERLKLTEAGREYSRASAGERLRIVQSAILSVGPYRLAVEWFHHRRFESVTAVEVASHWHTHAKEELGTTAEATIREQATTFFSIASSAGLGKYVVGRKGHSTRFEIDRDAITALLDGHEESPVSPKRDSVGPNNDLASATEKNPQDLPDTEEVGAFAVRPSVEGVRVFISHSKNTDVVEQIKTMLDLADMKYEVAEEEETTAIPVPEKVMSAMRRCTAAVICVTADEQRRREDGTYTINENVLIEVGAAFVLYDRKVVLVWDRRLPVPSNLQGLYRCQFEASELSWSEGMRLMKAMSGFKR